MAFPIVRDTNTSTENSNTTSHTVSLPPNIGSGDLLLVFFATDGDNAVTFPNEGVDWFEIFNVDNGNANHLSAAYRIADGGEGATITVTTGSSEKSAHVSYRIENHNSSTNPPEASAGNTGNDDSPDPDSLTATWGSADNLWIAMCGMDANKTVNAYPYADNNQSAVEGSATGTTCGVVLMK